VWKLDEEKGEIRAMYQWLSIVAVVIKPPPPAPAHVSPPPNNTLLYVLLIVLSLAFFGLLFTVVWMFRTGRWQSNGAVLADPGDQVQPTLYRNTPSPTYQSQRTQRPATNSSFSRTSASGTPTAYRKPPEEITFIHTGTPPSSPAKTTPPQREDLLRNKRWLELAEDCTNIFDELDDLMPTLDAPRQEISRHVKSRLREILIRSGVEPISRDCAFDESRHQLEHSNAAVAPGTPIVAFVSSGFAVERRVLRRAVVRVAPADES